MTEKHPSLDLIYAEARAQSDHQRKDIDALDTKAVYVLAAASVIVTLAPAARAAVSKLDTPGAGLTIVASLFYLLLILSIRAALRVREFDFPPGPAILYEDYLKSPVSETRLATVQAIIDAYTKNTDKIKLKAGSLDHAIALLCAESITLALALALG
jgi:hypothetical protein